MAKYGTHFQGPVGVEAGRIETVAAAKTLKMKHDNGKTFILNAAAGVTVTLPAVTNAGFKAKFIVGAAFATTNFVVASAEGTNLEGSVFVNGALVAAAGTSQINFVATAETLGDWVELESDGTYWYVSGNAVALGGMTST